MALELTAGWTGPLDLVLKSDGVPVVFTSSQHTPALVLRTRERTLVDTTGDVAWYTSCGTLYASCGTVTYTPGPADLYSSESPYLARVRITAGSASSEVIYFPNGPADPWTVYAP
jgi:hypothetical protein